MIQRKVAKAQGRKVVSLCPCALASLRSTNPPLHLSLICWRTPEKRRPVETTLRHRGTEVLDVASLPETFLMNADFAIAGLCWWRR